MKLIVVGPGRAGGALALAASSAGHEVVGVVSRSGNSRFGPPIAFGEPLPTADLLIVAVRDDVIEDVAGEIAQELVGFANRIPVVAHLSGFTPITALGPFAAAGVSIGGFHPLQTLPDPERGAAALAGSFVGIGGDEVARSVLVDLAQTLGMRPFTLDDEARPGYHAGAAAASNFVITALAIAGDLMTAAGIEPGVTRPLVEQAVANAYEAGAGSSLTGPIARGDTATVGGQLEAARRVSVEVGEQYRLMAEATAIRAGRPEDVREWR